MLIYLNSPNLSGNELKYLKKCIDTNWISSGKFVNLFENKISQYTKSKFAISCINGTSALQISLLLSGGFIIKMKLDQMQTQEVTSELNKKLMEADLEIGRAETQFGNASKHIKHLEKEIKKEIKGILSCQGIFFLHFGQIDRLKKECLWFIKR